MAYRKYRVLQWTTGQVGKAAVRGIVEHPELELVGAFAHGADKAGKDVGELCGLEPCGVSASSDAEALLAQDADAVCYTSTDIGRPMEEVVDEICTILAGSAAG